VRELRNTLEVAMINAAGDCIGVDDLPSTLDALEMPPGTAESEYDQRSLLLAALGDAAGNKSLAAQRLNCSRMTLYRRMRRLGVGDDGTVTL
jgi:transcriptional regulator of acetoin/glycerol metabolism